jgi:molybdopterin molybdotransferase
MLTAADALARILSRVPRLPAEGVPLADALGRVLAVDVVAEVDVPPWDNSAVDGYAVRADDLTAGDPTLSILEVVTAGSVPSTQVIAGTASAVMTGAPIPDGADTMVMVEDVVVNGEAVQVRGAHRRGQHIRRRGEDTVAGAVVLRAGEQLTAAKLGYAASVGCARVSVVRRARVGLLATGDELVAPGLPLGPGQIYSSNNVTLAGLVRELGGEPVDLGVARDDLPALVAALRGAAALGLDALVTTGGVSVGAHDFVKDALAAVGGGLDFWKVAMKPGKPLAFGWVGDLPVFGLPGNPVSCAVNFHEFVGPFLREAAGEARRFLPIVDAVAAEPIVERTGRMTLVRVTLEVSAEGLRCRPAGTQSSGALGSMARAHGLLMLDASSSGLKAGERGRVQVIDWGFAASLTPGFPE